MITYEEFVNKLANTYYHGASYSTVGYQRAGNETSRLAYEVMLKSLDNPLIVKEELLIEHIAELEKKLASLQQDTTFAEERYAELTDKVANLDETVKNAKRTYEFNKMQEMERNILNANENITTCETAEGRDILRAAQCFVNSVDIDTKYDNTAFIAGLGAILSQGGVSPLHELTKMNPRIKDKIQDLKEWKIII